MSAAALPVLAGTEEHPHARMVLGGGLASGSPSHAYLFHGPSGSGKRTAARALAAELLAEGDPDQQSVRRRVQAGSHPDLTWVRPTGAHVMRVDDVEYPVIAAATRTPFESSRRVFVLERADTMNDEVANRMLKTLEEPAPFVHIVLLTDAIGGMLDTVISRCQLVRFDPLPAERVAVGLEADGVDPARAAACARLGLGDASRARFLAGEEGTALRRDVGVLVNATLAGAERGPSAEEPWRGILTRAEARRAEVEAELEVRGAERFEMLPKGRERRAVERELEESRTRDARRARTEVLELGIELTALTFRDLACLAEGVPEAVLATDQAGEEVVATARARDPRRLREAVERCEETRQSLELNVTEELALSALFLRLERLVGSAG